MFDDLGEIWTHLKLNKLRTALTGLSVSVGIFLLITLLGSGNGLINAFKANRGGMAMDVVKVYPGITDEAYGGWEKGREIQLDNRDIRMANGQFSDRVTEAAGQISLSGGTMSYGDRSFSASLGGYYPANEHINKLKIIYGRYINNKDMEERRKVIVLSEKTAKQFFPIVSDAIGKSLRVDGNVYAVVGVFSDEGRFGGMEGHIPFTTLQLIYKKGQKVDQLTLRTRNISDAAGDSIFQRDFKKAEAGIHSFSPTDEGAIWMFNTAVGAEETDKAMGYLNTALWVIGLLTLLSGVVGISNIMLITVKERTHEFGIRKALGARSWSILRSVLLESVIITAISGYIGLVCGILMTEYLNATAGQETLTVADQTMYTFLNPTVDMAVAIEALAVLIVAGLVAGFFPAWKAVRVKPIEALNAH